MPTHVFITISDPSFFFTKQFPWNILEQVTCGLFHKRRFGFKPKWFKVWVLTKNTCISAVFSISLLALQIPLRSIHRVYFKKIIHVKSWIYRLGWGTKMVTCMICLTSILNAYSKCNDQLYAFYKRVWKLQLIYIYGCIL